MTIGHSYRSRLVGLQPSTQVVQVAFFWTLNFTTWPFFFSRVQVHLGVQEGQDGLCQSGGKLTIFHSPSKHNRIQFNP